MRVFSFAAFVLSLLCTTTAAQDSLPEEFRQKATITVMGEQGVEIELKAPDGQRNQFTLAGPHVTIYSEPGKGFCVNDQDSPTVGGVLTDDGVAFYGKLTLSSAEREAAVPLNGRLRINVFDALVEITTELAEASTDKPAESQVRTLNQQADSIDGMREKARNLRQQ